MRVRRIVYSLEFSQLRIRFLLLSSSERFTRVVFLGRLVLVGLYRTY
jgi:hypothetical protein